MEKIGVIGAGSWGTALAILLNENGNDVTLWSHRETEAEHMRQSRECSKLSGIKIPEAVEITSDLKQAVSGKKVLVMVVPSRCMRETAELLKECVAPGTYVISAAKGIEDETLFTMTDILE